LTRLLNGSTSIDPLLNSKLDSIILLIYEVAIIDDQTNAICLIVHLTTVEDLSFSALNRQFMTPFNSL